MDGYERELSAAGAVGMRLRAPREAITVARLKDFYSVLRVGLIYDDSVFFAASVVGVIGLLRGSEFLVTNSVAGEADRTLLRVHHAVISFAAVELTIPKSKTDQVGRGDVRRLPAQAAGVVCPVRALNIYLQMRRQKFGPYKRGDPLFVDSGNKALSRTTYMSLLKNTLTALGMTAEQISRFTAHSLRRGGAQSLADAGVAVDDIKFQGRWKSGAYAAYLRPGPAAEARLASGFSAATAAAPNSFDAAARSSVPGLLAGPVQPRCPHPSSIARISPAVGKEK